MKDFNVDAEFLEDGEYVLWAFGDLTPKKPWKYAVWGSILFALIYGSFQVYSTLNAWETWQGAWSRLAIIGLIAVVIIANIVGLIRNKSTKGKGHYPKQQSEYFVGMVTNNRLVLYSADREQDIILRRGDVKSVHLDYSNGARALRLELMANAVLPRVVITTSGDITAAKKLIEDGFLVGRSEGSAKKVQA